MLVKLSHFKRAFFLPAKINLQVFFYRVQPLPLATDVMCQTVWTVWDAATRPKWTVVGRHIRHIVTRLRTPARE